MSLKDVPESVFLSALGACLGVIIGASVIGEYGFNALACKLCYWQRDLYILALAVVGVGFLVRGKRARVALLGGSAVVLIVNACVAGYQVLVERKVIDLPAFCRPQKITADSLEALEHGLMAGARAPVPCDLAPVKVLGLTLAECNLFITTVMVVTILAYLNVRKRRI